MSEIPDDIHAKARAIARIADSKSSLVKYIERALLAERMAERARCEKAAQDVIAEAERQGVKGFIVGVSILAAIRNQDKP